MAKKKKKLEPALSAEAMASLQQQIAKNYDTTWDKLVADEDSEENEGILSYGESEYLKDDFWTIPMDMEEFQVGEFYCIPYCLLVDGGEPIATHNLELVKKIECQQAYVKVYKKVNPDAPGYLVYSPADCDNHTLYCCQ